MKKFVIFQNKLIKACMSGDVNGVEGLLSDKEDCLNSMDADNELGNVLLFVSSIGDKQIVELMINRGVNFGKTYKNGKTTLTVAYENGHRHLFDTLISNGANFNCQHGFELFLENCKKEEMEDFEFLLNNGAPTSGHEPEGLCPLMMACQNGFIQKFKFLLNHSSIDINKGNNFDRSSLHLACMNNHEEVARLLIEHGADVNSEDIQKETP
jgi:ankyrin repeat protein